MKLISTISTQLISAKVSYNVILSLLMGMTNHSQSIHSDKFAISVQYLKKEVRGGVYFLHAYKHQSFYKLTLLFLLEVADMSKVPKIGSL